MHIGQGKVLQNKICWRKCFAVTVTMTYKSGELSQNNYIKPLTTVLQKGKTTLYTHRLEKKVNVPYLLFWYVHGTTNKISQILKEQIHNLYSSWLGKVSQMLPSANDNIPLTIPGVCTVPYSCGDVYVACGQNVETGANERERTPKACKDNARSQERRHREISNSKAQLWK